MWISPGIITTPALDWCHQVCLAPHQFVEPQVKFSASDQVGAVDMGSSICIKTPGVLLLLVVLLWLKVDASHVHLSVHGRSGSSPPMSLCTTEKLLEIITGDYDCSKTSVLSKYGTKKDREDFFGSNDCCALAEALVNKPRNQIGNCSVLIPKTAVAGSHYMDIKSYAFELSANCTVFYEMNLHQAPAPSPSSTPSPSPAAACDPSDLLTIASATDVFPDPKTACPQFELLASDSTETDKFCSNAACRNLAVILEKRLSADAKVDDCFIEGRSGPLSIVKHLGILNYYCRNKYSKLEGDM